MISRITLAFAMLLWSTPAWARDSTAVPEGSHLTLFALGLLGVIIGRRCSMRRKPDRD